MYTDPNGESFTAFAIGFVVGAYLTGSLYNKDFTPWSTGKNGDESWAWDDPGMYVMMGIGGLAGGFGAAMGWGVIAEGYTFNMTLGTGIGEAVQTGAQFLVSNSGVVFEGLGYATVAGGGGFLTYEAIKGIDNSFNQPETSYWKDSYFQGTDEEAKEMLLWSSKELGMETSYWFTNKGYYFSPIQGNAYGIEYDPIDWNVKDYNGELGFRRNDINSTYRYTPVELDDYNLYIGSNIFDRSQVIYRAHTHPGSSEPGANDLAISFLLRLRSLVFGWNGNVYKYGGNGYWK